MNIAGLMWYDNDPDRDLKAKVIRGARHYRDKYGRGWPTVALVHQSVTDEELTIPIPRSKAKVTVRPDEATLLAHFLFVREDADAQPG